MGVRTLTRPTPARRIEKHADAIVAAVELDLSNSRPEGINAKIR
jgi:transposase